MWLAYSEYNFNERILISLVIRVLGKNYVAEAQKCRLKHEVVT